MAGHLAFHSVSLLEKLPLRIECMDIWDERLIVGTTEGVLLIYEVKEKPGVDDTGKAPFLMSLIDSHKSFSKKPIRSIEVLEDLKLMLSITDVLQVHALGSFRLHSVLGKSRGCELYAVDKESSPLRLCVAIKKKLLVYQWDGKQFNELRELIVPETAKAMVWCGDHICVGFKKEYNFIDIRTGSLREVFPTGKNNSPLITPLPNQQLLLTRDNISVTVDHDGRPIRKFGLSWSEPPSAVGYYFPYLIALLPKFLEVRTTFGTQTLVQMVTLRSAKLMQIKKDIYVAAPNHIWRLVPIPVLSQVDQLVREKEYENAISLCESLSNFDQTVKADKLKEIKELFAYHLFCQGQYERAMGFFLDLKTDPLQVLGLYPNLLPKQLRVKFSPPFEIPPLVGAGLENALLALINYLTHVRSPPAEDEPCPVIEDDYSTVTDVGTIIDTALIKAYVKTKHANLTTLLTVRNCCHIKECEKVLTDFTRFADLVQLYKGKNLHRKALELLAKVGQAPAAHNELHGPSETIKYLRELGPEHLSLIIEFSKWVLQSESLPGLSIFTERSEAMMLPPDQILSHLQANSPSLVTPYLEFLMARGVKEALFHNELVLNYLDTILKLKQDPAYKSVGYDIAGREHGALGQTRRKLLSFLETSTFYEPEKMLPRFPFTDLYEERALILSRTVNGHKQALTIYVYKLKNYYMAEQYCAKHYSEEGEESRDVYLSLLEVYLNPPSETPKPLLPQALAVLNKYYRQIDGSKALMLLPADVPLSELGRFFENMLVERSQVRREKQSIAHLLKLDNIQMQEQLIRARNHQIKITDNRECQKCSKRLGNTAFARYPNGTVVHYKCMADRAVCPVTGQRFG